MANLLLARAAARQKEISVRLAVGAGRIRLIRQLLTESLLLALTGGTFGLLLAWWGSHAVSNLLLSNPTPIPRSLDPSWRILGFTSAVSLLTGILFGLVPALRTTQIDLNMALKDSSRGLNNMESRLGWRGVLVISQVAVSLLLLIGAGLFVRSLQKLRSLDGGFERHNVLTLMIDPERGGYTAEQLGNLYQELLERTKSLPGVRAAGLSQNSLFTGNDIGLCCASVPGYLPRPGENRYVRFDIVSPGFFSTVGMPILLGRDFDGRDREGASKTVVVNEALVRHYFRDRNPLGGRFAFEGGGHTQQYEIVGIVKDAKYNSLRERHRPFFIYHSLKTAT